MASCGLQADEMANTFRERVAAAEAASRMEELKLQEVRRGQTVPGRL